MADYDLLQIQVQGCTYNELYIHIIGVNKMFPYCNHTTRVVRWYGMKSMRDICNHYAPRKT